MKLKQSNSPSVSLSVSKNSILLFLFALLTAGILAVTYEGTKETIVAAERRAAEKALFDIIPAERIDNDLLLDTIAIPELSWAELGLKNGGNIHVARRHQEVIAVIIPTVAADGYSGDIRMIAGVNSDGSVAGVRVLKHIETPGLGDKVDIKKSNWIKSFDNKSLVQPKRDDWKVKKDGGEFDQFTGATITPRAVVQQVRKVLEYVERNQTLLFGATVSIAAKNKVSAVDR